MQVIPAILDKHLEDILEKIKEAESHNVSMAQIDVADGIFVNNTTFNDPEEIIGLGINFNIDLEIHLMTEHPMRDAKKWSRISNVKRIIVHWEALNAEDKKNLKNYGVAINPGTHYSEIIDYLDQIKHVLFMGVEPGWSSQSFEEKVIKSIREFKAICFPDNIIAVDGGVNEITAPFLAQAGVDIVNVGSFLWYNDFAANYKWLSGL